MEETKEKEKMEVISFRIPQTEAQTFKAMASFFGVSVSQLFRDMIMMGLSIFKGEEEKKKDEQGN